jgi:hypothetical protein
VTLLELVVYLVLGAAAGAIVRTIHGVTSGWVLIAGVLGFLGAMLGTATANVAHLRGFMAVDVGGHPLPVLWSMSGAVFLAMWGIAAQVLVSSHAPS